MLYELDAKQVSHWQEFWQNAAVTPSLGDTPVAEGR